MHILTLVIPALLCCTLVEAKDIRTPGDPSSHSVDSRKKKHGDFLMLGTGKNNSILLSNNIFYEPAHKHDEKNTLDWQVQDPIRVLKTKDEKNFILLNRRTGETMKAKILNWH